MPRPRYTKDTEISKKLSLHFIIDNQYSFTEFFIAPAWGKKGGGYKTRYFHLPVMHSDDGVLCGGRSHGKSASILEPRIIRNMYRFPDEETLLSSFRKLHIKDRVESVISIIKRTPYLNAFVKRIHRDPHFEITLSNGHLFYGISTGEDPTALNILGKHPIAKYIEETSTFLMHAWKEWQSTASPRGCYELYCGVVDGRIDTPFRMLDTPTHEGKDKFRGKRFHIPRIYDPWWNEDMKRECVKYLGGPTGDDYLQQVLAKWGNPSSSVWDTLSIYDCMDRNVVTINLTYTKDSIEFFSIHDLPDKPKDGGICAIGMDTGFVEPTDIGVFTRMNDGRWRLFLHVELRDKMIYETQAQIVDHIATKYNAEFIGIDSTTTPIITSMLRNPNGNYKDKSYEERCIDVMFNENIVFMINNAERKQKTKNFATDFLRSMFRKKMFHLPLDEDIINSFNSEKQQKIAEMTTIKTPDNVHITDMFRCFAVSYYKTHMEEFIGDQVSTNFMLPVIANTCLFRPNLASKI